MQIETGGQKVTEHHDPQKAAHAAQGHQHQDQRNATDRVKNAVAQGAYLLVQPLEHAVNDAFEIHYRHQRR